MRVCVSCLCVCVCVSVYLFGCKSVRLCLARLVAFKEGTRRAITQQQSKGQETRVHQEGTVKANAAWFYAKKKKQKQKTKNKTKTKLEEKLRKLHPRYCSQAERHSGTWPYNRHRQTQTDTDRHRHRHTHKHREIRTKRAQVTTKHCCQRTGSRPRQQLAHLAPA